MSVSFMQKLRSVWTALRGGLRFADKKTIDGRKNLCYNCEIRNEKLNTCTACGCFIPAKIRLKDEQCPLEKW